MTTERNWTLDDVERLGRFMAEHGITVVELPGLKLGRHPKEAFYGALAQDAQKAAAVRQPTDEELLFNPLAGMEQ